MGEQKGSLRFFPGKANACFIEGDAFYRSNRKEMKLAMQRAEEAGNQHLSHFGLNVNLFEELEHVFQQYGETSTGKKPALRTR